MPRTDQLSVDERRSQWRSLIEQASQSRQKPAQFCKQQGLELSKFYYWRRVLAQEGAESNPQARFALVRRSRAAAEPRIGEAVLELELPRGWRLRIPQGVDEPTLRAVLRALSQSA